MNDVATFLMADVPPTERYALMLAAVAPRPIALVSSIDRAGNINLSPFSFFNAFSTHPPILVFSPGRRGRDNTEKDTHRNVREVPEVVINMVNYAMAEQMSLSSNEYDPGENEFIRAGFTMVSSTDVQPPRVGESPVAFECVVKQVIALGHEGGAGNLVICQVSRMHVQTAYLGTDGRSVDTTKLDLIGRMGGNWYNRAGADALFEIVKPSRDLAIGVGALPEHAQQSEILTGNDLGRLGALKQLPPQEMVTQWQQQWEEDGAPSNQALHHQAREILHAGEVERALALLMAAGH